MSSLGDFADTARLPENGGVFQQPPLPSDAMERRSALRCGIHFTFAKSNASVGDLEDAFLDEMLHNGSSSFSGLPVAHRFGLPIFRAQQDPRPYFKAERQLQIQLFTDWLGE